MLLVGPAAYVLHLVLLGTSAVDYCRSMMECWHSPHEEGRPRPVFCAQRRRVPFPWVETTTLLCVAMGGTRGPVLEIGGECKPCTCH